MTNNNNFNIFDLEERVDMLSDIKDEIEKIWEPRSDDGELFELRDSITKFKDMIKPEVHEIEQLSLSSSNSEDGDTNKEQESEQKQEQESEQKQVQESLSNSSKKEIINIKFINEEFEDFKEKTVVELDGECENESFGDIVTKLDRLNHDNNFNPDMDMSLEDELEKSGYIEPTMLEPVIENDTIDIEMKDMTADTIDVEEDIILDDSYFTGGVMDYVYKNKMYVITVVGGATVGGLLFGGVGVFFGAIPAVISGSAGTAVGGVVGNKVATN